MSEWIDTLDPMAWVEAMGKGVQTFPFWITVAFIAVIVIRYAICPLIDAWRKK